VYVPQLYRCFPQHKFIEFTEDTGNVDVGYDVDEHVKMSYM